MSDEDIAERLQNIADAHREHHRTVPSLDHEDLASMTQNWLVELARVKSEKAVLEARIEELEEKEQQRRLDGFAEGDSQ